MTTGKTIALTRCTFVGKVLSLLFNMLFRLVIAFLLRSKRVLISWLQSPSAMILEPKKIKSVTVSIVSPSICREVKWRDTVKKMLLLLPAYRVGNRGTERLSTLLKSLSEYVVSLRSEPGGLAPGAVPLTCAVAVSLVLLQTREAVWGRKGLAQGDRLRDRAGIWTQICCFKNSGSWEFPGSPV